MGQGVGEADLRSGIWRRGVVRARRLVYQAAPSRPLRPFWGWSNFPDLHGGTPRGYPNIESRMSNDEPHDPLHTKNATGAPAAPVSFDIHHSSVDIRYCLKIFLSWFRLGRGRGDDLIRQSGNRLRNPPQGQEIPERALEPPSRISGRGSASDLRGGTSGDLGRESGAPLLLPQLGLGRLSASGSDAAA